MNAALGNVGTTVTYTQTPEAAATAQLGALRELAADMDAGRVDTLVIVGSNPVFTAPVDLRFSAALEKVRQRVHVGLYVRRDRGAVPLAHSRDALPGDVERRAGRRRHRDGLPTAHRAALRLPVGARDCSVRSSARCRRRSRSCRASGKRRGTAARPAASARSPIQRGPSSRPSRSSGAACCTTASCPERRSRPGRWRSMRRRWRACRRTPPASGLEITFRPDPVGLRRALRQQRLAAGAAQALRQGGLGQRRVREPADGRGARAARARPGGLRRRGRDRGGRPQRACAAGAGVDPAGPAGRLDRAAPRLRAHGGRPRRQRAGLQRELPALFDLAVRAPGGRRCAGPTRPTTSRARRATSSWRAGRCCGWGRTAEYQKDPHFAAHRAHGPARAHDVRRLEVRRLRVGHGDRPQRLHRLQCVRGRVRGGEQHPGRRQGCR